MESQQAKKVISANVIDQRRKPSAGKVSYGANKFIGNLGCIFEQRTNVFPVMAQFTSFILGHALHSFPLNHNFFPTVASHLRQASVCCVWTWNPAWMKSVIRASSASVVWHIVLSRQLFTER